MADKSEYRLLSLSIRKSPKYGSILSKDLTQKQNFIVHNVQTNDTLQGIALKYNVSVEKIKRANNLWTSNCLFIHPTLSIPINKPSNEEACFNGKSVESNVNNSQNNSKNKNEHNNNSDFKISLNQIEPEINNQKEATTSKEENLNKSDSLDSLKKKDESMNDFLSRIDNYIKLSKNKVNNFAGTSEIISSQSDDDLFKLSYYNTVKNSYRQHSVRENEIRLNEIRDKHSQNIVYSLKKLEKDQEKFFEL